jgi:hypothetical protein
MVLWVVLFMAYMIWARFGLPGLEQAATMGALFVGGLGVRSFLDTFWNCQKADKKEAKAAYLPKPPSENRYKRGIFYPRPQEIRRTVG